MCYCLKKTNQQDHRGSIFLGKKNLGGTILFCVFSVSFIISGRWFIGSPYIIFFLESHCLGAFSRCLTGYGRTNPLCFDIYFCNSFSTGNNLLIKTLFDWRKDFLHLFRQWLSCFLVLYMVMLNVLFIGLLSNYQLELHIQICFI